MLQYYWAKLFKKIRGVAYKNSQIHHTAKMEAGSQIINSTFDKYSFCGYDCQIINCSIGAFTSIANNVVIGGAMHPMEWVSMSPVFYEGRDSVKKKFAKYVRPSDPHTVIGNDVWIGEGAILKAGITVGDGAVIGMGSVVTKDIQPYCIYAGNPARLIRKRFSDEIVEVLLEIKWWEWKDNILQERAYLFNNVKKFIALYKIDRKMTNE